KQKLLIASTAGYGFVTEMDNLHTRNQKGKALLTLPEGARPLVPQYIVGTETFYVVAVTGAGRMLAFPLADLPELSKGKGNKLINIISKEFKAGEDYLKHLALLPEGGTLTLFAGKRHFKLVFGNMANFMGTRAQRGKKLPRGFQNVDAVTVEKPAAAEPEGAEREDGAEGFD
ncbi:MAG: DNA gyrase C-terminal beta-propeller domain-containing protein, partial [Thermodesulfobacteriota bacterium]